MSETVGARATRGYMTSLGRWALLAATFVVACGGNTAVTTEAPTTTATAAATTTTTTTTMAPTTTTLSIEVIAAAEFESDTAAIRKLFRDYSDSWAFGVQAAVEFVLATNHPAMGIELADLGCFSELPEGFEEEIIVDRDSIERDDEWVLPPGMVGQDMSGEVPAGRIYVMQAELVFRDPAYPTTNEPVEIHAAILDGDAFMFFGCRV